MARFLSGLAHNPTLKKLSLKNCKLGDGGVALLSQSLKTNTTLSNIDLRHNGLSSYAVHSLSTNINCNWTLRYCLIEEWNRNGIGEGSHEDLRKEVEELKSTILRPNQENMRCMKGEGEVLNFSYRTQIPIFQLKHMILHCSGYLQVLMLNHCNLGSTLVVQKRNQIGKDLFSCFSSLQSLTWLSLTSNNLSDLPKSIVGLSCLKHLDFSNNQISQFPEWMVSLQGLEMLLGSDNLIREIPKELVQLPKLVNLCLTGNPITKPDVPAKFLKKKEKIDGRQFLIYMRDQFQISQILNRCKVILLGDNELKMAFVEAIQTTVQGKRSVRELRTKKPRNLDVTEPCLHISSAAVQTKRDGKTYPVSTTPIDLLFYNLDGARRFHSSYSLLSGTCAVYVLVMTISTPPSFLMASSTTVDQATSIPPGSLDQSLSASLATPPLLSLQYWLSMANVLSQNCPLFIVCLYNPDRLNREAEGNSYELSTVIQMVSQQLKSIRNFEGIFPVNQQTTEGTRIFIEQLECVTCSEQYAELFGKLRFEMEVPMSWVNLSERAEKLRKGVITWGEWRKIGMLYDIKDEADLINATCYLHHSTKLRFFNETVPPTADTLLVFDSKWLAKVLTYLLKQPFDVNVRNDGSFHAHQVEKIWAPIIRGGYPPSKIVDLLIQLNFLFKENKEGDRILAPLLASPTKPPHLETMWHDICSDKKGKHISVHRSYEFSFLPEGYFSSLVVKLLKLNWQRRSIWLNGFVGEKNGIFLRMEEAGFINNSITIIVRGTDDTLLHSLKEVVNEIQNIGVNPLKKLVPCYQCLHCKVFPPELFTIKPNTDTMTCVKCKHDIRVDLIFPD